MHGPGAPFVRYIRRFARSRSQGAGVRTRRTGAPRETREPPLGTDGFEKQEQKEQTALQREFGAEPCSKGVENTW